MKHPSERPFLCWAVSPDDTETVIAKAIQAFWPKPA